MPNNDMPIDTNQSDSAFPHQLFHGTTWHSRLLPSVHKFAYPYRYWGINITALASGQVLPEVNAVAHKSSALNKLPFYQALAKNLPLFSAKQRALQQFYADDYLQDSESQDIDTQIDSRNSNSQNSDSKASDDLQNSPDNTSVNNDNSLSRDSTKNNDSYTHKVDSKNHTFTSQDSAVTALKSRLDQQFKQQTGSAPIGDIIGMVVCRNAGIYFSPVNFYIGFDAAQTPTHLLAEVSNTPWDKRHYYGFLLNGVETEFYHDKDFHVSPFNPIDQLYSWQVKVVKQKDNCLHVRIAINISDSRGEILKTGVKMSGIPMKAVTIKESLRRNPLMNVTSLTRIYWHAFKLYAIKKVPYINYDEKLADSEQQKTSSDQDS